MRSFYSLILVNCFLCSVCFSDMSYKEYQSVPKDFITLADGALIENALNSFVHVEQDVLLKRFNWIWSARDADLSLVYAGKNIQLKPDHKKALLLALLRLGIKGEVNHPAINTSETCFLHVGKAIILKLDLFENNQINITLNGNDESSTLPLGLYSSPEFFGLIYEMLHKQKSERTGEDCLEKNKSVPKKYFRIFDNNGLLSVSNFISEMLDSEVEVIVTPNFSLPFKNLSESAEYLKELPQDSKVKLLSVLSRVVYKSDAHIKILYQHPKTLMTVSVSASLNSEKILYLFLKSKRIVISLRIYDHPRDPGFVTVKWYNMSDDEKETCPLFEGLEYRGGYVSYLSPELRDVLKELIDRYWVKTFNSEGLTIY